MRQFLFPFKISKMKRIIAILLTMVVILTACKKEHDIKKSADVLHRVTFQVGFSQISSGFTSNLKLASADTSVTNNINMLYYMVYDSNGKNLLNVSQDISDVHFGTIIDSLHAGSYTVAVIGLKGALNYSIADLSKIYFTSRFTEVFFKKMTFTVGDVSTTQAVNLQRINSKLQVIIKDKIPSNITEIQIHVVNLYNSFAIGSETGSQPYPFAFYFPIPSSALGTANYTLSSPTFISNGTLTVDITALNGRTVISQKTLDVTTAKNKVTVLSGNLFGGNGGSGGGFTLSLPAWNAPVTQGF